MAFLKHLFTFLPLCIALSCQPSESAPIETMKPPFLSSDTAWVDSIYSSLSWKQRLAQMCMIRSESISDANEWSGVLSAVENYGVGGVAFFKGDPSEVTRRIDRLDAISAVPMLYGIDGEWGLAMRLENYTAYPWNMTLGAIQDNALVAQVSEAIAREIRDIGIDFNFAPSVDVNNNPLNPIINQRSFGENPATVAEKGMAFLQGHRKQGVFTSIKHFPGHGDTEVDSHKDLPLIDIDSARLDSVEYPPFTHGIAGGADAVMIAHLDIPSLTLEPGLPSSTSSRVIDSVLKTRMGFRGLVITDGLGMQGVRKKYPDGELEKACIQAGNDMLLLPQDISLAIDVLYTALLDGTIDSNAVRKSCKKILHMKAYQRGFIPPVQSPSPDSVRIAAMTAAHTLLQNPNGESPVLSSEHKTLILAHIGKSTYFPLLEEHCSLYTDVESISLSTPTDVQKIKRLRKSFPESALVVVHYKPNRHPWHNHSWSISEENILAELSSLERVVYAYYGNPYSLAAQAEKLRSLSTTILGYQDNRASAYALPRLLYGAESFQGTLPVSIDSAWRSGFGLSTTSSDVLYVAHPSELGISSQKLQPIDSLLDLALSLKATPGGQVFAAYKNAVFLRKSFGVLSSATSTPVALNTLYDVASITKTIAGIPLFMDGVYRKRWSPENTVAETFPSIDWGDKGILSWESIWRHQSGLKPWIPFYRSLLDDKDHIKEGLLQPKLSDGFGIQLAENSFLKTAYKDSILTSILHSPLQQNPEYKYSDLGFYILHFGLQATSFGSYQDRLERLYTKGIGAHRVLYHPLKHFTKSRIAPSEKDTYFRQREIRGFVHDMGAAMLGNEGLHAGVFANADDVGKVFYLFQREGKYGGEQYFDENILSEFTSRNELFEDNRRGIGFDKPMLLPEEEGPCSSLADPSSFGHSGFTGTLAWTDPEQHLTYVFLSNRTYPSMENTLLIKENIRTLIHDALYRALPNFEQSAHGGH